MIRQNVLICLGILNLRKEELLEKAIAKIKLILNPLDYKILYSYLLIEFPKNEK